MIKFIKLTEKYKNGNSTPILLNAGCIKSIKISDQGKDTHVLMQDNKYYFVTESVEDIWNMLNSKPITITDVNTSKVIAVK